MAAKINNYDLYTKKWSVEELAANIDNLSLKSILYTQMITAEFAVKYILTTDNYACCVEETYYDIHDVLDLQPHLNYDEIIAIAKKKYAEKQQSIASQANKS